ncbi:class A beta-lactamase [Marilutibacter alkalisoli]|uniref:Beta-lactamase n=1 Tax=Marilutibacter alkalisoli TaxID=2591633 RepID=A0A514BQ77_9GAMM|nr:class A beta-lactamase [Lysobacter alkalisoli]QDH69552.1 class A beta-lactamase [Lysobacter alkalisoli]
MSLDMTSRRRFLAASLGAATLALPSSRVLAGIPKEGPLAQLAALERRHGGQLGVAILDAHSGRRINHRGEERFALLSTFKFLAAALVLARVDRGEERLERRVVFEREALVPYSPVTEGRTGGAGMSLAELCHATVTISDNTAGNLLLESFGGPPALTAFARTLGDRHTRLDRIEPELNIVPPGEERDTTTPAAMLTSMRALLIDETLSAASRQQLVDWLVATSTGDARLRAGFPQGWRVGNKTGTNGNASNDIAIAWPPGRAPLLVSAYYDNGELPPEQRDAVLAEVGRIVASLPAGV